MKIETSINTFSYIINKAFLYSIYVNKDITIDNTYGVRALEDLEVSFGYALAGNSLKYILRENSIPRGFQILAYGYMYGYLLLAHKNHQGLHMYRICARYLNVPSWKDKKQEMPSIHVQESYDEDDFFTELRENEVFVEVAIDEEAIEKYRRSIPPIVCSFIYETYLSTRRKVICKRRKNGNLVLYSQYENHKPYPWNIAAFLHDLEDPFSSLSRCIPKDNRDWIEELKLQVAVEAL